MEKLKAVKERLMRCIESQVYGDLKSVDTKELGEAIDMIADLEEAIYYCTITKAMEKSEKEKEKYSHQEAPQHYYPYYNRDMDRGMGRMSYPYYMMLDDTHPDHRYYNGNSNGSHMGYRDGNAQSIGESRSYPMDRDYREGKSPISRKTYMESKELHKDTKVKMQDLEKYMQELSHDMVEMIEGATPEEKQLLQQKLTLLASKVK